MYHRLVKFGLKIPNRLEKNVRKCQDFLTHTVLYNLPPPCTATEYDCDWANEYTVYSSLLRVAETVSATVSVDYLAQKQAMHPLLQYTPLMYSAQVDAKANTRPP